MDGKLSTTPEELFMLIGEREFIKHKLQQQNAQLLQQAGEMAAEITSLRAALEVANGRLEQPPNNDAV